MDTAIERSPRLAKTVHDLDVFRLAYGVSIEIHKASLAFPKIEQYALADQIRRSSKSVCANVAEGFAKQAHSKAEFRRFLSMAIGSANETSLWLLYARDLEYMAKQQYDVLNQTCLRVARMLQALRSNTNVS